jgi:hypothetical protein
MKETWDAHINGNRLLFAEGERDTHTQTRDRGTRQREGGASIVYSSPAVGHGNTCSNAHLLEIARAFVI